MLNVARIAAAVVATTTLTATSLIATTTVAAAVTGGDGRVIANGGVTVRYAPTSHSASVGTIPKGKVIPLACKLRGPSVAGNTTWYALPPTLTEYVSARYVENVGAAPGWCTGTGTKKGKVNTALSVRTGPSTSDAKVGTLTKGTKVDIRCKLGGQNVGGNDLWYYTTGKRWISAKYVDNVGAVPGWCTG